MYNSNARSYTISELMRLAEEAIARQEYILARYYYERTTSSNCGRLKYSQFLIAHSPEDMSVEKRITEIEKMLQHVERNGVPWESGVASSMLAEFYSRFKNRPLRSLGYILRAFRLGEKADEHFIRNLNKKFSGIEISYLEEDILGSYLCGIECGTYPEKTMQRWSYRFLETVALSGAIPWAGLAAMHMADLFQEKDPSNKDAIDYWLQIASENGNPEVLTR